MQLSRVHIAFLAIMSLFTGIIGPGTKSGDMLVSYAMTDMRVWIFFLLILLVIGFYAAAVRSFRILWFLAIGILLIISVLFMATLLGNIHDVKHMVTVSGLSWGWIFLIIGLILLFWSLFRKKSDDESIIGSYADMTIGVIGGITLALLSGMIIITSLSLSTKTGKSNILEGAFGTGSIEQSSGMTLWGNFRSEPRIDYDRRNAILIISSSIRNNNETQVIQNGEIRTFSGVGKTILKIGNQIYEKNASGEIFSGTSILTHAIKTSGTTGILYNSGNTVFLRTENGEKEISFLSGSILYPADQYILSEDMNHLVRVHSSSGGVSIERDSLPSGGVYQDISNIHVASNGANLMIVATESGSTEKKIIKNGIPLKTLGIHYINDSYRSNGDHYFYREQLSNTEIAYFDGGKIPYTLDEVRESFLEKNGGSYAFFGRVSGNRDYCLFTRYHGNLCGLEGYMSPIIGADGVSIIFAGKKGGIWSIYRNTEIIESETGYENTDISHDYVFFDLTNPRTYLFVKKDVGSQQYILLKNGKVISHLWEDIGIRQVVFGFDNHILLPVRENGFWKILEI